MSSVSLENGSLENGSLENGEGGPVGTLEDWARAYVLSNSLAYKLGPPPPPAKSEPGPPFRIVAPGRPLELELEARARKAPRPGALVDPQRRAELFHTFLHHELQAAELMCWAILAFPETPDAFKRGLSQIAMDEVRHMNRYRAHLVTLGSHVGAFPVRDWFWERVPTARTPAAFVALLGVGFEGGNLDHSARYAEHLRAAGDVEAARIEDEIGREEIAHVRFALRWLEHFAGGADYDTWVAALPPPITPLVLRGKVVSRSARAAAGMSAAFLDRLEAYRP